MIAGNYYLSRAQTEENAKEFYNYMLSHGFNVYAVCAMLGNIQVESGVNPGIWENLNKGNLSGGYGLTQWTPATKVLNWLSDNGYNMDSGVGQMERIIFEKNNGLQWGSTESYPLTFNEFANYTNSSMTDEDICKYLANAFLRNYERPDNQNQPQRGVNAYNWFLFFGGERPEPEDPGEPVEPDVPIVGCHFDYIYLLSNQGALGVGQEYKYLCRIQFTVFNKNIMLKLVKEVDETETYFDYIGNDVYKRRE